MNPNGSSQLQPGDPPDRRRMILRSAAPLLAITLAGAAVRFWGIHFGLPLTEARPDEPVVTGYALGFYRDDFNPHFFRWPSFFFYITHFLYRIFLPFAFEADRLWPYQNLVDSYIRHPAPFFLIPRVVSAVMGTLTIPLLFWCMRRLDFDNRQALLAALFLAFTYLHARDSHFGVTDVSMTALLTAAIIPMAGIMRGRMWWPAAIAGLLWGLSSTLKYNALLLGAPVVCAFSIAWMDHRLERRKLLAALGVCVLGFLAGFIGGSPYILLDYKFFIEEFLFQVGHVGGTHGIKMRIGWVQHLIFTLPHGAGLPMMAMGAAGVALAFRRSWRGAAVLFCFPILYYAAIGKGHTVFVRYMIPVLPFLAAGSGIAASVLINAVERKSIPTWAKAASAAIIIAAVIGPSIVSLYQFNRLVSIRDNRLIAAEYLIATVEPGQSVGMLMTRWAIPNFRAMGEEGNRFADGVRVTVYDPGQKAFLRNREAITEMPDFILVSRLPMPHYELMRGEIKEQIERDYVLVKEFYALPLDEKRNKFDQQDAFFIPYARFHGVERPGPNFELYRKKQFVVGH